MLKTKLNRRLYLSEAHRTHGRFTIQNHLSIIISTSYLRYSKALYLQLQGSVQNKCNFRQGTVRKLGVPINRLNTVIVSIFSYLHLQIMYEVVQVVDEGLTQVGRAGRVNPKYEGKGFIKYFGTWIADWRKMNNIRTIAFTVVDANPAIKRHSFQQRNRHVLTKVYLEAFGPCQAKKCLQTNAKMSRLRSSCTCTKYHPVLCSPFIHSVGHNNSVREQWSPLSDYTAAQSALGLLCPQLPEDTFWCGQSTFSVRAL